MTQLTRVLKLSTYETRLHHLAASLKWTKSGKRFVSPEGFSIQTVNNAECVRARCMVCHHEIMTYSKHGKITDLLEKHPAKRFAHEAHLSMAAFDAMTPELLDAHLGSALDAQDSRETKLMITTCMSLVTKARERDAIVRKLDAIEREVKRARTDTGSLEIVLP